MLLQALSPLWSGPALADPALASSPPPRRGEAALPYGQGGFSNPAPLAKAGACEAATVGERAPALARGAGLLKLPLLR